MRNLIILAILVTTVGMAFRQKLFFSVFSTEDTLKKGSVKLVSIQTAQDRIGELSNRPIQLKGVVASSNYVLNHGWYKLTDPAATEELTIFTRAIPPSVGEEVRVIVEMKVLLRTDETQMDFGTEIKRVINSGPVLINL